MSLSRLRRSLPSNPGRYDPDLNYTPIMRFIQIYLVLLIVLFASSCASSGELASTEPANPLLGNWEYAIDTPDGIFRGGMYINEGESGLSIGLTQEGQPEGTDPLLVDEITFDEEAQSLSFSFVDDDYGKMVVNMVLGEEGMAGTMRVTQFGVDVPMTAMRAEE